MLALAVMACGETPPPEPPPPPPPEPAPEPKPEPKCEALKEKCRAGADTQLKVLDTDLVFTPPAGWIYAQLEEAAVAQVGDEGAVLVMTTYVPDKALKAGSQRTDLTQSFSELVFIEPPATLSMAQPNTSQKIAGLDMKLWERPGAKRGKDVGGLLVLSADLGDRELFGLGFAPKDDDDGTAAILAAIQSLEAAGGAPKDGDDKDEDKDGK